MLHRLSCLNRVILMIPLICCSLATWAQESRQVRGKVVNAGNEPLPGVSVIIKGTSKGTSTTTDGNFLLEVNQPSPVLVFSFIGYKSQEQLLGSNTFLKITLEEDEAQLGEVVVIGYGKQSREAVTTAVSKLDNKVLENIPYTNVASALQGAIPGLRVQSTSGQPGAAPRVILRGGTSINNPNGASPLYIVDGIIRSNMNDISADDIESLQVLKDAAATAIYGARGSNGVVIITTRTGKEGKMRVTYSYDLSVSKVGRTYELASARDYINLGRSGTMAAAERNPAAKNRLTLPLGYGTGNDLTNNTAYTTQYLTPANEHKLKEGWESMPDPLDPSKTIIFKETDFQALLYRTALSHDHHIAVSGGTEKATFNAGVGYLTAEGTTITTQFKRLTFNMNGELKAKENLSFFGRAMYSSSQSNEVFGITEIFYRSLGLPPTAKYTFEDGTLAPGQNRSIGNPVYHLNNRKIKNAADKLTLAVGAHWDLLPGLSFDPQVSLYKESSDGYSFQPGYLNGPTNFVATRSASGNAGKLLQTQADAVLSYNKSFNAAHNLEAKAGFSYYGRETTGLNANGQGASTDLIPTLNASAEPVSVSGSVSNQVIIGYFSRINYDYKQRYLFSLNVRYDGASNLGAQHKWGFFPGVSVGWNLHQEEFWKALPQDLLRLKLRGSYGVNGNITGLSDFQAMGEYNVGARYGGNAAIQNSVIPNDALRWEQSKTFDVGADIGLFKSRVNILFDYYRRITDNLITSLSLPPSTGFGSILTNLGSLQNKGIEIELNAQVLPATAALQWMIGFNASKTVNKIMKLPANGTENNRVGGFYVWDPARKDYAWLGGLQEGGRLGDFYAYKQVGIYATDADAKAGPVDMIIPGTDKTKAGGDVNWQDTDGNGLIDERDRVYVGNQFPVWTGGFTSALSYKNFDFTVRLDYTTGHTIYNYARAFMDGNWQGDIIMTKEMAEKSWKKSGDITDYPRYYWNDQTLFNLWRGNSQYYEKGDFLAIREVTLSYNMPKTVLQRLKINGIRVHVTGNNLYYFTKYKGPNPEEGGQDNGHYPIPRNIIFGANISF
ncbi:SusC/RagA family TonB-linked outer membrane protein [Chitinophaga defluvii]|uniref:TonB-dependent receptor n=1 Tax=Chitinophaga defluvii TaxID=3163343 RepID=A0ABV2T084_9BACT